jgi:hypothetical protein
VGTRRDLQAFLWLFAFSTSQAESRPTHLPLTQTVGRLAIVIKAVEILEHVCYNFY